MSKGDRVIKYTSFEELLKSYEGKSPVEILESLEHGRKMAMLSQKVRVCRKHYADVTPTLVAMGRDKQVSVQESRLFDRCEVCGAPAWKTAFIHSLHRKVN